MNVFMGCMLSSCQYKNDKSSQILQPVPLNLVHPFKLHRALRGRALPSGFRAMAAVNDCQTNLLSHRAGRLTSAAVHTFGLWEEAALRATQREQRIYGERKQSRSESNPQPSLCQVRDLTAAAPRLSFSRNHQRILIFSAEESQMLLNEEQSRISFELNKQIEETLQFWVFRLK